MIEFIRWRVRLALISYESRVVSRERTLTYRYEPFEAGAAAAYHFVLSKLATRSTEEDRT